MKENRIKQKIGLPLINLLEVFLTNTIKQVKKYLDGELAKYKSWETSDKFIRGLCENQKSFETTKGMGVGREIILKFLGEDWKQSEIQFALKSIGEIEKHI